MIDLPERPLAADADLLAVSVVSLLPPLLILLWPESPVRAVVGLAVVGFAPGYAATAAAIPERPRWRGGSTEEGSSPKRLGLAGRLALSVGVSVAVVALVALALSYASLGVRLRWILPSLAGVTVAASGIACWRREKP